jgi:hypothetical protein
VAEQSIPLVPAVAEALVLGPLVPARDAARVALGGVHLGTAPVEPGLLPPRPALSLFAVRRHRSSNRSKLAFSLGYHVTTG